MPALKIIEGRHGRFLCNPRDVWIGGALATYGEYSEAECRALCEIIPPGSVVVEVGANVGALTVPMARKAGMVIAFEPQRVVFQQLCANLALNEIVNVMALWAAASDRKGVVLVPSMEIDADQNNGGQTAFGHEEGDPVQVLTIDSLALESVQLIKADVEGHEREVILGAENTIARCRPYLYVENDRVDKSPALIETILGLRYRAFWHTPPLFNPENHAGRTDDVWRARLGKRFLSFNMICVPAEYAGKLPELPEVTRGDSIATLYPEKPLAQA